MATAEEFETVDAATVRKMTTTARTKEIDMTWAGRIRTLGIGQGFKTSRPDTETVRQFKQRINRAADYSHRSLDWTTLDPKPTDGSEPVRFLAKVKAIDTRAIEAENAQTAASANGTPETSNGTDSTAETAQRPARPR
jgi:hypothetical protein